MLDQIANLEATIAGLEGQLDDSNAEIVSLQGQVTSLEGEVTALEGNVFELEGIVADLNGQLVNANGEVARLSGMAQVPQTGQNLCYGADGGEIDCAGTGQDGELQKGVPICRGFAECFSDNGDGTVTDPLTGLVWLKDADCFGALEWTEALAAANGLAADACGLSDGSAAGAWRLPNRREMMSLQDYGDAGSYLPGAPFQNVQSAYWTSTSFPFSFDEFAFMNGDVGEAKPFLAAVVGRYQNGIRDKSIAIPVWPVRDPD